MHHPYFAFGLFVILQLIQKAKFRNLFKFDYISLRSQRGKTMLRKLPQIPCCYRQAFYISIFLADGFSCHSKHSKNFSGDINQLFKFHCTKILKFIVTVTLNKFQANVSLLLSWKTSRNQSFPFFLGVQNWRVGLKGVKHTQYIDVLLLL